MSGDRPYAVGYKRPPEHTRFKKGRSGNPSGRPKDTPNVATALKRALEERVVVTEQGQRRSLSKMEVMVKQLVNKAAGGDLRAFAQVQALIERDQMGGLASEGAEVLHEEDQKVLQGLFQRMRQEVRTEVKGHPPEEDDHERA